MTKEGSLSMQPIIEIQYRKVPRDILEDFEQQIDTSIHLKIYEDPLDHFDPPPDLVIYVNEHLTEIIIGGISGVLTSAIWDGVKALWRKVIKKSTKEHESDIELNFKISSDNTIEFHLSGKIDHNRIDSVVSQMMKYLSDVEQHKRDFSNVQLLDKQYSKPRIRVRYNPSKQQIEVVNATEERKRTEEMLRKLMDGLSS